MVNAQKRSKDTCKIVHVTSGVQPWFYEATRILIVHKENNNNRIYSAIIFPELQSSAILESTPNVINVISTVYIQHVRAVYWM